MDFQDNDNNNEELMSIFQSESEEILEHIFENLMSLEKKPGDRELSATLYRNMHSLKGAIRMVGFNNIQTIIHKIEDIFDAVNTNQMVLEPDKLTLITKSVELAAKYLQESIQSGREIIGEDFNPTVSALEYMAEVELNPEFSQPQHIEAIDEMAGFAGLADLDNLMEMAQAAEAKVEAPEPPKNSCLEHQEEINYGFNTCFELINSIVPEEESQETVILKEEIAKLYERFESSDLYEVKTSLQNILTKLDFVMNATNTFTISEILELSNELSSAAAKFNTSCISEEADGTTFFEIAEKINMLQGSSV